jgi:deferrochelatase/peroxidase EfeB
MEHRPQHLNMKGMCMTAPIDFSQIQGLVRFGYASLTEASFLLVTIRDAEAARSWMRFAPVSNAVEQDTPPKTALQIAFTREGLECLALSQTTLAGFSIEFRSGMSAIPGRSRMLGDVGKSDPQNWTWGTVGKMPHMLVLLYAQPGYLSAWSETVKGTAWNLAFDLLACLPTSDLGGFEPFGFRDGISQPSLDWELKLRATNDQAAYTNLISLGEVLLGYPNEYGRYTDRPMVSANDPYASALPVAEAAISSRDLGRDGCYLVLRTLKQNVQGFWQFVNAQTASGPEQLEDLAAAMVGRRRDGSPLVPLSEVPIPGTEPKTASQNQFTFDSDPSGVRCPFGAHIRRANPRNADLPTPPVRGIQRFLRILGLGTTDLQSDAKASTRFHRIVRRGREYGSRVTVEEVLIQREDSGTHGIHFICLVANIARQFEFLQSAWLINTKFDAMTDESDPLLGNREPVPGAAPTDTFTRPHEDGVRDKICSMPQFVTVEGGAYFFLPSLAAIRYLSRDSDDLLRKGTTAIAFSNSSSRSGSESTQIVKPLSAFL